MAGYVSSLRPKESGGANQFPSPLVASSASVLCNPCGRQEPTCRGCRGRRGRCGSARAKHFERLHKMRRPTGVHRLLKQLQLRDAKEYTEAISALVRAQDWRSALSLLEEMQVAGVRPDASSFKAAIPACKRGMRWQRALMLLQEMRLAGEIPDLISFNAVMSACEKHAHWQHSLSLLQEMQVERALPDLVSYNAAISACRMHRQWQHVLQLLREMRLAGVTPSVISFNAAISACEHVGMWPRTLSLLEEMQSEGHVSDCMSFSAVMSACVKGGQWQRALSLLQEMRWALVQPNVISFGAAMTACIKDGQGLLLEEMRLACAPYQQSFFNIPGPLAAASQQAGLAAERGVTSCDPEGLISVDSKAEALASSVLMNFTLPKSKGDDKQEKRHHRPYRSTRPWFPIEKTAWYQKATCHRTKQCLVDYFKGLEGHECGGSQDVVETASTPYYCVQLMRFRASPFAESQLALSAFFEERILGHVQKSYVQKRDGGNAMNDLDDPFGLASDSLRQNPLSAWKDNLFAVCMGKEHAFLLEAAVLEDLGSTSAITVPVHWRIYQSYVLFWDLRLWLREHSDFCLGCVLEKREGEDGILAAREKFGPLSRPLSTEQVRRLFMAMQQELTLQKDVFERLEEMGYVAGAHWDVNDARIQAIVDDLLLHKQGALGKQLDLFHRYVLFGEESGDEQAAKRKEEITRWAVREFVGRGQHTWLDPYGKELRNDHYYAVQYVGTYEELLDLSDPGRELDLAGRILIF